MAEVGNLAEGASKSNLDQFDGKILHQEKVFLDNIPHSDSYEKSFMHRDIINFVTFTESDFLITASSDGHVKFWKKNYEEIVFVKHFKVHLGNIIGVSASVDGFLYCTVGSDKTLKVFDVLNFDMINMIPLGYAPLAVSWIYKQGHERCLVAVSDKNSPVINIYDGKGSREILKTLHTHRSPVSIIKYNSVYDFVISVDQSDIIEYWDAVTFAFPSDTLHFEFKTDTDLYEFIGQSAKIASLSLSKNGKLFSCVSADGKIRVFHCLSGKIYTSFDESKESSLEQQSTTVKMNDMEFGKKLSIENEIHKTDTFHFVESIFDESSNYLIYSTMFGIKIVNLKTSKCCRILGKNENVRFLSLSLYQGIPNRKRKATNLEVEAAENPILMQISSDPTIACTGFNKNRFYLFSNRDPSANTETDETNRDIFNEKPTKDEIESMSEKKSNQAMPENAILHTSMGDIQIRLHVAECPKTVENFVTHGKNGYYNNLIFHRVIAGFMIQTGDPLGNGTGGESIWGGEFEDEFHPSLRHSAPYMVSMANSGPNTNGSQFFITVAPAGWLDNKHTIFGKIIQGASVAKAISQVKTNRDNDKPLQDVTIVSISFK